MKGARGMKVGATRKGFYMFSRDLLSSRRYRCCSWVAKGVYLDLLNVMAVQPKPGAVCLTDFDLKPKSERSLTFRCLQCQKKAKNGEYQSIKYFAEAIAVSGASGPRPGLIHGLQELYLRGMIVIEGDMLIQPRMYQDNGYRLAAETDTDDVEVVTVGSPDDGEADPDAEALRLGKGGGVNGAEKGTQNVSKNTPKKSRVDARDARAQSRGVELEVENINNSKGIIGGAGGVTTDKGKTQAKSPKDEKRASNGVADGDAGNLPSDGQKRAQKPENAPDGHRNAAATPPEASASGEKVPVATIPPSLREIQDYMQQRGEQGTPFRHITAEEYYDDGCQNGWTIKGGQPLYDWRARLRSLEGYRRKNGEPAVTQEGYVAYRDGKLVGTLAVRMNNNNKGYEGSRNNQHGAARSQGGHTEGDDGMLQQSVRIISRLRASREAEGSDGTDSDGDPF